ncbi:FecR domain-containing protein [Chitinophaga sp.]|uniref:FecR family protein n=1 Tax=Chitinophaga sp. TaxID=1869181 RepID=UPI0031D566F4
MEELLLLIRKYRDGNASEQEKERLFRLFLAHEEEIMLQYKMDFLDDLKNDVRVISPDRSADIFAQIQANKSNATGKSRIVSFRWLAAASVIGLALLTGYFFTNQKTRSIPSIAMTVHHSRQHIIKNSSGATIKRTLEDGSIITITAGSTITYNLPFETKRDIQLTGTATFDVAKDEAKPFTVYTNSIGTTALGTRFTVRSTGRNVLVQLLSGKVVVRAVDTTLFAQQIYLKPGQQCTIDPSQHTLAVSKFTITDKQRPGEVIPSVSADMAIHFSKTPLQEVFKTIGQKYHKRIIFNTSETRPASFSGSFLPSDSFDIVLQLICNTNDLTYKEENGVIFISK